MITKKGTGNRKWNKIKLNKEEILHGVMMIMFHKLRNIINSNN